jgi:DNA polymerase III epsilon subunit-like protein
MKYIFLDTETTGLPKSQYASHEDTSNWPRMVQLAWIVSDGENILEEHNHIIFPDGFVIPDEVAAIHGISQERALLEGKKLEEVLQAFDRSLAGEEMAVVAHNIRFDFGILGAEFVRQGLETKFFSLPKMCTMTSATKFMGRYPKLNNLHLYLLGTEFSGAHDARADVKACHDCFFAMKKKGLI